MKQPVERRLAAILAADVAGYSRLMGADEEGTHERLKAHLRELVEPKIAEHRGRTVKNTAMASSPNLPVLWTPCVARPNCSGGWPIGILTSRRTSASLFVWGQSRGCDCRR